MGSSHTDPFEIHFCFALRCDCDYIRYHAGSVLQSTSGVCWNVDNVWWRGGHGTHVSLSQANHRVSLSKYFISQAKHSMSTPSWSTLWFHHHFLHHSHSEFIIILSCFKHGFIIVSHVNHSVCSSLCFIAPAMFSTNRKTPHYTEELF